MAKHTIKFEDFKAPYIIYHELASSSGNGSRKALIVRINISNNDVSYEVKNQLVKVYETSLFDRAIEFYNELP